MEAEEGTTIEPKQLFLEFMRADEAACNVSSTILSAEECKLREMVIQEGVDTIEKLLNTVHASSSRSLDGSETFRLSLDKIVLQGFGKPLFSHPP